MGSWIFILVVAFLLSLIALYIFFHKYNAFLLQRHLDLGQPVPQKHRGTAIVIGGGMGGLSTAAMLSHHFAEVHLFEKDCLQFGSVPSPDSTAPITKLPENRKSIPQGEHAHGLLLRGLRILASLFPNFQKRLLASGGVPVDSQTNQMITMYGKALPPIPEENLLFFCQCRPVLETLVRNLVKEYPSVKIHTNVVVKGLLKNESGEVSGIRYYRRPEKEPKEEEDHSENDKKEEKIQEMLATLVVDASGRYTNIDNWLSKLGYPAIPTDKIDPRIAYSTFSATGYEELCIDNRPPGEINFVYIMANPVIPVPRAFIMIPTGLPNRCLISAVGEGSDDPPSQTANFKDFLEWSKKSDNPYAYQILSKLKPVEPWKVSFHRPIGNVWRRVDKWSKVPDGLIILGDAQCAFNPVHAQGMTNSLIHVNALDAQLRRQTRLYPDGSMKGLAKRFYSDCSHFTWVPFFLAVVFDSLYSNVSIKYSGFPILPSFLVYPINKYIQHFLLLAHRDPQMASTFVHLFHLLATPFQLFAPKYLLSTLWHMATSSSSVEPPLATVREQKDCPV